MLESRGRPDLAEETIGAECGAEVGVEDLDGDVAVMPEVEREEDGGHAAGADLAIDAIAVAEGVAQALVDVVGHVRAPGKRTRPRSGVGRSRECIAVEGEFANRSLLTL